MKWNKLNKKFPNTGDNVSLIFSDGEKTYIGYEDKKQIWITSDHDENDFDVERSITHWVRLDDIKFNDFKED